MSDIVEEHAARAERATKDAFAAFIDGGREQFDCTREEVIAACVASITDEATMREFYEMAFAAGISKGVTIGAQAARAATDEALQSAFGRQPE